MFFTLQICSVVVITCSSFFWLATLELASPVYCFDSQ